MPPLHFITVSLKKSRYNGLKKIAIDQHRSVSGQLDFILQQVGVIELTDEELKQKLAGIVAQEREKTKPLEELISK